MGSDTLIDQCCDCPVGRPDADGVLGYCPVAVTIESLDIQEVKLCLTGDKGQCEMRLRVIATCGNDKTMPLPFPPSNHKQEQEANRG